MNGLTADLGEVAAIARAAAAMTASMSRCAAATLIGRAAEAAAPAIGGERPCQTQRRTHRLRLGGDAIDAGATLTIVGHSERRQDQHENRRDVRAKAKPRSPRDCTRFVRRRKR